MTSPTSVVVQKRNAEMTALASADLLSVDDKNICAMWYNSAASAGFIAQIVVPLNVSRHNFFTEVYQFASSVLTITQGGLYLFDYSLTITHSGSGEAVYQARIEENQGSGWVLIPESEAYVTSFAGPSTIHNSCIIRIEPNWQYRVGVNGLGVTGTLTAQRSKLSVMRLFKNG